jgi:hypothetical protein
LGKANPFNGMFDLATFPDLLYDISIFLWDRRQRLPEFADGFILNRYMEVTV